MSMAKAQRSSSGSGVGGTPQGDEHIFLRLKAVEGQKIQLWTVELGDDKEGLTNQSFQIGRFRGNRRKQVKRRFLNLRSSVSNGSPFTCSADIY